LKISHALVCAALLAGFAPANAQTSTDTHPVLQKRPPRDVLNSDLLALPDKERQAWVHGAVAQMATVIAGKDRITAGCIMDWYFNVGNGSATISAAMKRYPEAASSGTILAIARRACPDA